MLHEMWVRFVNMYFNLFFKLIYIKLFTNVLRDNFKVQYNRELMQQLDKNGTVRK